MTFAIKGLIEGFYDRVWTWEERRRVASFIGERGFDTYVYAPKSDGFQNTRWRLPYPEEERRALAAFGDLCRSLGMAFWIGLRPLRISYADLADAALVIDKLRGYLELGADRILLLADDIPPELDEHGSSRFASLADAHAWLVEMALAGAWLAPEQLAFCPTEYHGRGSAYLETLGVSLPAGVDICWTGLEVCSPTISAADADAVARLLRRKPLIWDNYPVNDAVMLGELHLGPIRGRDPALAQRVRGVLVNPALEPEATLIPLATWAEYFRDPTPYDPDAAWRRALLEVAGNEADADALAVLAAALDQSVIEQGWERPPATALSAAQARLRDAANRRLVKDLEPFLG
ncbi:MAG TPA: beta-N-acetylglucosaminidase domain-containing protein [Candidatus Limnocylindria bacterium]|nr:beta-N-acetylglucosaminidase domain-containing protein [Candidatus Limnocylindria bacterium]